MNRYRLHFALIAILCFGLSGCQFLTRGPDDSGLNIGTVQMPGVLEKQIQFHANGYWEVSTAASWLTATPESGFGDATITLSADPNHLEPGEYVASLAFTYPFDDPQYLTVVFAFPKLRGSIVLGPEGAEGPGLLSVNTLPEGPGRLLVGIEEAAPAGGATKARGLEDVAAELVSRRAGLSLAETLPGVGAAVVEASNMRGAAASLLEDPRVRYVEQDLLMQPLTTDPFWAEQWSVRAINADQAWSTGDGTGVRIAVIDSGLHQGHPDLDSKVVAFTDYALQSGSNCGTHGTHVAGIAAAETDNAQGIAGIAPASQLLLYNAGFISGGECVLSVSAVVRAIDEIVLTDAAAVINMSFGTLAYSRALHDSVKGAYADGITIVAAAGNSSTDPVLYPAAFPEVIAVSATNAFDQIASYSARGPEVFLSAPGGDGWNEIWSTITVDGTHDYGEMVGTSMASPAVAGAAAVLLSIDPGLSPLQVAGILADTSVDLGPAGRDDDYGYGLVDLEAAALLASDPNREPASFLFRSGDLELQVHEPEQFVAGYVGPGDFLEVGSDDDWDGNFQESGEYYDDATVGYPFGAEFYDVTFYVEEQP